MKNDNLLRNLKPDRETRAFAIVPLVLLRANISERAKSVYSLAAVFANKETSEVWLRRENLAKDLFCSVASVQRAINELIDKEFLIHLNKKHLGRYPFFLIKKDFFPRYSISKDSSGGGQKVPKSPVHQESKNEPGENSILNNDLAHPCVTRTIVLKQDIKEQQQGTMSELIKAGLSSVVALNLIKNHGEEACELQLKNLASQKKPILNKAGWLRNAIVAGYAFLINGKSAEETQAIALKKTQTEEKLKAAQLAFDEGNYELSRDLCKNINHNTAYLLQINIKEKLEKRRSLDRAKVFESRLNAGSKTTLMQKANEYVKKRFGLSDSSPFMQIMVSEQYYELVEQFVGAGVSHA